MELTKEIIQETGLTEQQVQKISEFAKGHISKLETTWSRVANDNAENILEGAAKSVEGKTGIKREMGQKLADYFVFAGEKHLTDRQNTLKEKETQLNEKLKNSGHNETIVKELETTKEQLDKLKAKEAVFAEWETNDYKGKFQTISTEYENMKVELAFNQVKPAFPDNVNKYEADFKWQQFKSDVLSKNKIQIVEGEPILIDKENEYKTSKLSDLIAKNEGLASLLKGQNNGFGSKPAKTVKIEGVPFDVPADATPVQRQAAIKEYLAGKGISVTHKDYAKEYAELNQKILSQKTAK